MFDIHWMHMGDMFQPDGNRFAENKENCHLKKNIDNLAQSWYNERDARFDEI